jgi:hypothetical protein
LECTKSFTDRGLASLKCPEGKDCECLPDRGKGRVAGLNLVVTAKGTKS